MDLGKNREATLSSASYYSDSYFSMSQLCSLSTQIHAIHALRPKSILEIGPGNGFTSSFLRKAGYPVTTADINPELQPDICAPLDELPGLLAGQTFDLVVCCEVLEHIPLAELANNIAILRSLGDRLYMTLPNFRRSIGWGGFLKLPFAGSKLAGLYFNLPIKKPLPAMHYWEVGSERASNKSAVVGLLAKHYAKVDAGQYALNPYHLVFTAS